MVEPKRHEFTCIFFENNLSNWVPCEPQRCFFHTIIGNPLPGNFNRKLNFIHSEPSFSRALLQNCVKALSWCHLKWISKLIATFITMGNGTYKLQWNNNYYYDQNQQKSKFCSTFFLVRFVCKKIASAPRNIFMKIYCSMKRLFGHSVMQTDGKSFFFGTWENASIDVRATENIYMWLFLVYVVWKKMKTDRCTASA